MTQQNCRLIKNQPNLKKVALHVDNYATNNIRFTAVAVVFFDAFFFFSGNMRRALTGG